MRCWFWFDFIWQEDFLEKLSEISVLVPQEIASYTSVNWIHTSQNFFSLEFWIHYLLVSTQTRRPVSIWLSLLSNSTCFFSLQSCKMVFAHGIQKFYWNISKSSLVSSPTVWVTIFSSFSIERFKFVFISGKRYLFYFYYCFLYWFIFPF